MLKDMVALIVLYCCETLVLNTRERRLLNIFDTKFLRNALGLNIMGRLGI